MKKVLNTVEGPYRSVERSQIILHHTAGAIATALVLSDVMKYAQCIPLFTKQI